MQSGARLCRAKQICMQSCTAGGCAEQMGSEAPSAQRVYMTSGRSGVVQRGSRGWRVRGVLGDQLASSREEVASQIRKETLCRGAAASMPSYLSPHGVNEHD